MNLVYRKCTLNDLYDLIEISKTTFIAAFEQANNPEDFTAYIKEAFNTNTIKNQLKNPDSTFVFIYLKDLLVGYYKINEGTAQNEIYDASSIELERIYVLPKFIGQGIGKHILETIIAISKTKKVDFIWLGVWQENVAAIKFYKRCGFKIFGKHPYFLGSDEQTDYLMKFEIS